MRVAAGKPKHRQADDRRPPRGRQRRDRGPRRRPRSRSRRRSRRKAVEQGLIDADRGRQHSTCAARSSCCSRPGFSTAETTSDISGRGVGMDAVRAKIRELGGEVLMESTLGVRARCAQIRLPLTLAIVSALQIESRALRSRSRSTGSSGRCGSASTASGRSPAAAMLVARGRRAAAARGRSDVRRARRSATTSWS